MNPSGPGDETSRRRALDHWGIQGLALGISIGGSSDAKEWMRAREWVERADATGLHSVWMPEMHFTRGGSTSPLLSLAALAASTRQIRLATTSLLVPIHNPLRIAEEVASLDHLSQGRVILGLGRGFRAPLFSAFGIDPSTKRERFDAALDIILEAWRSGEVALEGTPFAGDELPPAAPCPAPFQDPHPPLAVAAFGPKGLAQATRRGLPYLASPIETYDQIAENLARHREEMTDAASPGRWVTPIMRTVFVSNDASACRRVSDALAAESAGSGASTRLPAAVARAVAAPADQRLIVGSVDEVQEKLGEYQKNLGMNLVVARPQIAGASEAERRLSFDLLAGEVIPALS